MINNVTFIFDGFDRQFNNLRISHVIVIHGEIIDGRNIKIVNSSILQLRESDILYGIYLINIKCFE